MNKTDYTWNYGENGSQKYYDCYVNKDYLCVVSNNWNPDVWFCMYQKEGSGTITIMNKAYNDREVKKRGFSPSGLPYSCQLLCSNDIEYLKKKLVHCYENNKKMITP